MVKVCHRIKKSCFEGLYWASISVTAISTIGCGSPKPPPYPADYKAKFEKRVGSDESAAREFVKSIGEIPPMERANYVKQHWSEAKNLAKIPDQDLQAKYRYLMLNRQ